MTLERQLFQPALRKQRGLTQHICLSPCARPASQQTMFTQQVWHHERTQHVNQDQREGRFLVFLQKLYLKTALTQ